MSNDRLRRLGALESRLLRPKFKPFAYAAAIDLWLLACHAAVKANKAYPVPRTYEPSPDTPTNWPHTVNSTSFTTA